MESELDRQVDRPWSRLLVPDGSVVAASVPELAGCFSEGSTMYDALLNVQEALILWLSAALKSGYPIPTPVGEKEIRVDV